eukprot:m.73570 g.73570  ORF g.73570 m.73570 type:complete len:338 (+) comp14467_c0_seq2:231-1244(+)
MADAVADMDSVFSHETLMPHILSFLDERSLLAASHVSRQWRTAILNDELWAGRARSKGWRRADLAAIGAASYREGLTRCGGSWLNASPRVSIVAASLTESQRELLANAFRTHGLDCKANADKLLQPAQFSVCVVLLEPSSQKMVQSVFESEAVVDTRWVLLVDDGSSDAAEAMTADASSRDVCLLVPPQPFRGGQDADNSVLRAALAVSRALAHVRRQRNVAAVAAPFSDLLSARLMAGVVAANKIHHTQTSASKTAARTGSSSSLGSSSDDSSKRNSPVSANAGWATYFLWLLGLLSLLFAVASAFLWRDGDGHTSASLQPLIHSTTAQAGTRMRT